MRIQLDDTVALRCWRSGDREPLARQANDRRVWINLRDRFPYPYSLDDADRFLAMVAEMDPPRFLAVEVSGEVAGGVAYTLHGDVERVAAEVSYWLGTAFWGQGVATKALRGLTRHVFLTHSFLRRLYAVPFCSNPASARVLEKAGYRREAVLRQSVIKDGVVLDQWVYAILRDEVHLGSEAA
jgi:RimJ/RimL family protein N-acetyltransferase